jgi:hypothetical protein
LRKVFFIIILFTVAFAKAQYFDLQYPVLNSIQFKNKQASTIYKSYKGNISDLDVIVNQLNTLNIDSIGFNSDISNIYVLKALVNLNKNLQKMLFLMY